MRRTDQPVHREGPDPMWRETFDLDRHPFELVER
jgi:hypothetical protein